MGRELARLGGFVVGAMIPSAWASLLVQAAAGTGGFSGWILAALTVVVGVGCWVGSFRHAGGRDDVAGRGWLGGLMGRAALAFILGLGGGAAAPALGLALARQGSAGLYAALACLVLVAGACGIIAGWAARRRILLSATAGALYGLLCGFGIPLAMALVLAGTYRPCPPHAFCLNLDPARALIGGVWIGTFTGLWLACVIWCSLALGLALTANRARPKEMA
jgi:hypothetical protein